MNSNTIPDGWRHANHVSFGDVRRRLDGATLSERNAILEFIRSNPNRIRPAMDEAWLYDTMACYFLDCIAQQTAPDEDDSVHTRFEAAHEFVEWFNWIVTRDNNAERIQIRIDRIASFFKNNNSSVQHCIETGFLEHVLEAPRNRPYFAHWIQDEMLAECYTEALRWGEAHAKPNDP